MRKLLITRGAQGSGKSTAIGELGLLPWCVSADRLREALGGPVMTLSGELGIPQDRDAFVWKLLYENLEERMARGDAPARAKRKPGASGSSPVDADLEAVQTHLEEFLGLQVRIKPDEPGKGTVSIRYRTLDQLDLVCQRLTGGEI